MTPLAISLLACSSTSVDRAVSHCETELAATTAVRLHPQVFERLSEPCMDALALNIGLELDGVPQEESPSAYLLTGLFVLLADESRTIGEAIEEEGMPLVARNQMEEVAQLYDLDDQDPVGWAWLAYVAGPVQETYLLTEEEYTGGVNARWGGGTLYIPDIFGWLVRGSAGDAPVATSWVLVHEAAHSRAPAHVACPDRDGVVGCDEDEESARGAELWFAQQWVLNHPEFQETFACTQVQSASLGACKVILDEPDWPICQAKICGDD